VDYRGESIFAVTKFIDIADLGFVIKIDKNEILEPLFQKQIIAGIEILSIVFGILIISNIISRKYSKHTIILKNSLHEIGSGNFDFKVIPKGPDEIKELVDSINKVGTDLKEKSKIEQQLVKTKKELEVEKFSTIGELSSRMAHDIRNPLSVIQTSLENLKLKYGFDGSSNEQFDRVARSIFRITHQIDNVLDYVKRQDPILTNISFSDIITESMDSIHVEGNVEIILPPNDLTSIADKKLFSIAINNLILNGVQSINGKGTVKITIEEDGDAITIQVMDSGKGIPPDNLKKIFEPLFTTKQMGTGLGLASVKSIIESHGGIISVTSPPTVFTIVLPKTQNFENT